MKDIQVYYSPAKDALSRIVKCPIELDISPMTEHYTRLGAKYSKTLNKFMESWNSEWNDDLLHPLARVVRFTPDETNCMFGGKVKWSRTTSETLLAVWTIGAALEKKCSELMTTGDAMAGLMLDVAGSIALYEIHRALMNWVRSSITTPGGLHITDAFYPGFGNVDQKMMNEVADSARTKDTIGVEAQNQSLLSPRKSQCSFLMLSTEGADIAITATPCAPCNGKQCLYYQLGGCHMQILGNACKIG